MNKLLRYSVLAAFVGTGVAHADTASTTGGIKIKSDDGNFSASIGGRIHFDGYLNSTDNNDEKIGSAVGGDTGSDFEFRRTFLSLAGSVYGYDYHIDYDLSNSSFQDVWVSHALLPGGTVFVGQHKPWLALDEIASNNNTVFLERNATSATGIYGGADYTNGIYYAWHQSIFSKNDSLWAGASGYSLHKQASGSEPRTQGTGYNFRLAYAPIVTKTLWAHVGAAFADANVDTNSGPLTSYYNYGGRTGQRITLVSYGASAGGNNPHADIIAGELAGAYGPVYFQGEYSNVGYHQEGRTRSTAEAYSATVAWSITGETRPYDKGGATFGGIKPAHSYGAFEVAFRYDYEHAFAENGGLTPGFSLPGITSGASSAGTVTNEGVKLYTVGLNYYPNPAVRFVLNYEHGEADLGDAGKDSPDTVGLRMQLAF